MSKDPPTPLPPEKQPLDAPARAPGGRANPRTGIGQHSLVRSKFSSTIPGIPAAKPVSLPPDRVEGMPGTARLAPAVDRPKTRPYLPSRDSPGSAAADGESRWGELYGLFRSDVRKTKVRSVVDDTAFDPFLPAHLFARPPIAPPTSRAKSARRQSDERSRAGVRVPRRAEPLPVELGAILDKYRIDELLGVGGFAVVYRATHLLLRMPVAIKMLLPRLIEKRPALAASLFEEARFAARINHPNVVRVFDVSHTPALTYVVMEYLAGSTLAKRIATEGALSTQAVVDVGIDVASGLAAGLEQGLTHRDIKPANIITTPSGTSKIVDLGLAGVTSFTPDAKEPMQASVLGTFGYMAPERIRRGFDVDFRADIYSLGATLYHAAVGRPPFPLDHPDCMRMHCELPVPRPDEVRPGSSRALSDLLLWMLAKDPDHRPASYEALIDALRVVLQERSIADKNFKPRGMS
jgi:hypothetical protein